MNEEWEAALRGRLREVLARLIAASERMATRLDGALEGGDEAEGLPGKESPAALLNLLTRVAKTLAQMTAELGETDAGGFGLEEDGLSHQERVQRINSILDRMRAREARRAAEAGAVDADSGAAGDGAGEPG